MKHSVSLLISTFNHPQHLFVSLQSALRQSVLPDEIIIADDGSDLPTAQMIETFSQSSPVPIIHVWHEHDGFRKTIIMNKAIATCTGEYVIQIDGDIMLHADFVADHLRIARHGWLSCGTRVMLNRNVSEKILSGQIGNVPLSIRATTLNALRNRFVFPVWAQNYRSNDPLRMTHGCNCAFWRSDLLLINGYNEDFVEWGYEDSDLIIRLENAGIRKQIIKFGAIEYHLYHEFNSRINRLTNYQLLKRAIAERHTKCQHGLDKYLPMEVMA